MWRLKHYEIGEATYPGYWPSGNVFRDCVYFYEQATSFVFPEDAKYPYDTSKKFEWAGQTMWQELEYKVHHKAEEKLMLLKRKRLNVALHASLIFS